MDKSCPASNINKGKTYLKKKKGLADSALVETRRPVHDDDVAVTKTLLSRHYSQRISTSAGNGLPSCTVNFLLLSWFPVPLNIPLSARWQSRLLRTGMSTSPSFFPEVEIFKSSDTHKKNPCGITIKSGGLGCNLLSPSIAFATTAF